VVTGRRRIAPYLKSDPSTASLVSPLLAEPHMMSKLYAGFLVIASLFAMAALGVLILILITDLSNLVIPSHNPGMSR
jgi:hypothetical protein